MPKKKNYTEAEIAMYERITHQREDNGTEWKTIAMEHNTSVPNIRQKHKRFTTWFRERILSSDEFDISIPESHSKLILRQEQSTDTQEWNIPEEMLKYGEIDPTGYVSDLSNEDWILKYIGGTSFSWKGVKYFKELLDFIWNTLKGLILLPRGHGKTTASIALFVRWICETQQPLLVITSPGLVRNFIVSVIDILYLPSIRLTYGDIIGRYSVSKGEIRLRQDTSQISLDPVFSVLARGASMIGRHPKWIHLEDVVQEKMKKRETARALREWYTRVISKMAISGTKVTATGTRKGIDDFYSFLMKKGFDLRHKRAINLIKGNYPVESDLTYKIQRPDGMPAYKTPSGFTQEYLKTIEAQIMNCPNWSVEKLLMEYYEDPVIFECEMQNNPIPTEGIIFKEEHWIEVPPLEYVHELRNIYISIDPSFTGRDDYCAIVVAALFPGEMIIFDGMYEQMTWDEVIEAISFFHEKYIIRGGCMDATMQQQYVYEKAISESKLDYIRGVKLKQNKVQRITALRNPFRMGIIKITTDCPIKTPLKKEYLSFDGTDSTADRHDDGLDATSMLREEFRYVLSPKREGGTTAKRVPEEVRLERNRSTKTGSLIKSLNR
jgi:predicted phage terminase large subunit-like protein